jgi:hypothetical protein
MGWEREGIPKKQVVDLKKGGKRRVVCPVRDIG